MKAVYIRGAYAVGMHHWGPRSLTINELMYLKHEPENPYDKNAVAICTEEMSKCAYLRKDDAKFISRLFKESLVHGPVYLKAKDVPTKFRRQTGPMQRCDLCFKTDGENETTIREICKHHAVELTFK